MDGFSSRRHFLGSLTAAAGVAAFSNVESLAAELAKTRRRPSVADWAAIRADFPRLARKLWLNASATHPFNVNTIRALEAYSQFRLLGPGAEYQGFSEDLRAETKRIYSGLIGASPEDIAFCLSTTDGENVVVAGLELEKRGGNIVIDDLHFAASEYLYSSLANLGVIELRVVKNRNWTVDIDDMERAIDSNTRLVSMALVSNVNGYMHDAKAISEIAHANGALVYGDIIQGAGCAPIDVNEMGLDCCANSSYKYLMGDFGLGFLYVRPELQGEVVKQTRWGLQQVQGSTQKPGAAGLYEGTTSFSYPSGVATLEGLRYIESIGIPDIRSHAKQLTDRLHDELPRLGYAAMTPRDNPTPTVTFEVPDGPRTNRLLDEAFGESVVAIRTYQKNRADGGVDEITGMRIGVSVYNNDDDIDQLLAALSR